LVLYWICSYQEALLLIKSEFLQKSSCNSLKKQNHNRSRGLQLTDISTADKLHALAGTLVESSQKLCPTFREDIPKCEAELIVTDLNPADDTDFADDSSDIIHTLMAQLIIDNE
uniref:Uncharacterized protein n=1 Tax=Romanomermis culicivorax TaxID=13658 RepID=A0A915L3S2_ROMCU